MYRYRARYERNQKKLIRPDKAYLPVSTDVQPFNNLPYNNTYETIDTIDDTKIISETETVDVSLIENSEIETTAETGVNSRNDSEIETAHDSIS
eukprot:UN27942